MIKVKKNLENNFLNLKKLSVIILIAFLLLYNVIAERGSIAWKEFYPDAGENKEVFFKEPVSFHGNPFS